LDVAVRPHGLDLDGHADPFWSVVTLFVVPVITNELMSGWKDFPEQLMAYGKAQVHGVV
jgi:hypothetical protein